MRRTFDVSLGAVHSHTHTHTLQFLTAKKKENKLENKRVGRDFYSKCVEKIGDLKDCSLKDRTVLI